jgi:ATP-dependent Clp protease ATP-binding subunit ClpA
VKGISLPPTTEGEKSMFERFTERARRVVVLAQEEARMLDHNYIGTEHLLLGLIREDDGVAARVIRSFGLTLEAAREQVERIIGRGQEPPSGHIPFTPRAKKVLELSLREALALKKNYIDTGHILLGLVREGEGVGAQILERVAVPSSVIRENVIELADADPEELGAGEAAALTRLQAAARRQTLGRSLRVSAETVLEFRDALASIDRRLAGIERHLEIVDLDGDDDLDDGGQRDQGGEPLP